MFKKFYYEGKETNYSVSDDGKVRNDKTGQELKGTYASNEYQRVSLRIDGKQKMFLVHRLVAETFIPNPKGYSVVNHIDGNDYNNHVSNLRWIPVPDVPARNNKKKQESPTPIDVSGEDIEWREIPFKELNDFEISNNGAVRRKGSTVLKSHSMRNGYVRYSLCGSMLTAHRLVYLTFVGEIPDGYVIDHINGIRDDNRVENLRCITQSENMKHSQEMGHKGQKKIEQYDKSGNFIKLWPNIEVAAKEYSVTSRAISSAAKRDGTSCGYKWKIVE